MYNTLEIMRAAQSLASFAGARQTLIATNVANADTPGYRAVDLAEFSDSYRAAGTVTAQRATRAGHITGVAPESSAITIVDTKAAVSPNGNSVSLESEMVKAAETRLQHDMALSIYQSSLNILRASIGRR